MQSPEFNEVLKDTFAKIEAVLVLKAEEYADDQDRLRNFKLAAHLQEESPIQALQGMLAKHTVSVNDLMSSDEVAPLIIWDEKIIDSLNYLILLRALVVEHHRIEDSKKSIQTVEGNKR